MRWLVWHAEILVDMACLGDSGLLGDRGNLIAAGSRSYGDGSVGRGWKPLLRAMGWWVVAGSRSYAAGSAVLAGSGWQALPDFGRNLVEPVGGQMDAISARFVA